VNIEIPILIQKMFYPVFRKIVRSTIWVFFLGLPLAGCEGIIQSRDIPSIKINLEEELETVSFSNLIKENVSIVSFQDHDLDGKPLYFKNINRLALKNGEFYVLDYIRGQFLMVFGQDGAFKRSIGFRGEGPGGYLQPMDFKIIDNEIEVLDVGRILAYDLDGNYLGQRKIPSFMANGFEKIPNGYAFIGAGMGTDNLILTDELLDVQNSFFPYHTRAFNVLMVNPLFENPDGKTIYRRYLNDTLFQVNDFDRPNPYIYIDFQQNKSNYPELLKSENVEEAVQASWSKYCNIYAYYETDSYIFIVFSLNGERWNFIYSNSTGQSKTFRQSSLIDEVTFDPNMIPVGVIGNNFVIKANPENVLAGLNNFQGRSQTFQKLKELEESLDPEGNPILFLLEFDF
jgi:hypothetical protein